MMAGYIRPSQCPDCVPAVTHEASNEHQWTVELAHQPDCPNHPSQQGSTTK